MKSPETLLLILIYYLLLRNPHCFNKYMYVDWKLSQLVVNVTYIAIPGDILSKFLSQNKVVMGFYSLLPINFRDFWAQVTLKLMNNKTFVVLQ